MLQALNCAFSTKLSKNKDIIQQLRNKKSHLVLDTSYSISLARPLLYNFDIPLNNCVYYDGQYYDCESYEEVPEPSQYIFSCISTKSYDATSVAVMLNDFGAKLNLLYEEPQFDGFYKHVKIEFEGTDFKKYYLIWKRKEDDLPCDYCADCNVIGYYETVYEKIDNNVYEGGETEAVRNTMSIGEPITECSLVASDSVCFTDDSLNKIAEYVDVAGSSREEKVEEIKKKTGCDSQKCVADMATRQRIIPKEEIKLFFKISGPTDTSLLSNIDIDTTMKQWSMVYNDFYPCKFSMVDYERVQDELYWVNMKKIYTDGKRTFGCVINSDNYNGRGKHWMALFADMRGTKWTAEFFNSSGNKVVDAFGRWQKRTVEQFKQIKQQYNLQVEILQPVRVSNLQHQMSKTECGVYSLAYIWCRLNGVSYEDFSDEKIDDELMFEFRQHLFNGKNNKVFPDGKFDENIFGKHATLLWEEE